MQAETTAALPGLTFDGICVATFAATQLAFCIGALHIAESTLNAIQTVHLVKVSSRVSGIILFISYLSRCFTVSHPVYFYILYI